MEYGVGFDKGEGEKLARRLKSAGWTVNAVQRGAGRHYLATHEKAPDTTLQWRDAVTAQRILDEAASALGEKTRTTSGQKRKERRDTQRQQETLDREAAHRARVIAYNYAKQCATPSVIPARHTDFTDTRHALERAAERGITGSEVQQALVHPLGIRRGSNSCVQYVGENCVVAVDPRGRIVTVYKS